MIQLALLTSLSFAQDPLGLGIEGDISSPDPIDSYSDSYSEFAESTTALAAETTVALAPAEPAATVSAPEPVGSNWMFTYLGPLALLGVAGGALLVVRKKGLKLGNFQLAGVDTFKASPAGGPSMNIVSRTPLAGQQMLALIEVQAAGEPRHLLVASGPNGSQLISDLSAPIVAPAVAPAPRPVAYAAPTVAMEEPVLASASMAEAEAEAHPPVDHPPIPQTTQNALGAFDRAFSQEMNDVLAGPAADLLDDAATPDFKVELSAPVEQAPPTPQARPAANRPSEAPAPKTRDWRSAAYTTEPAVETTSADDLVDQIGEHAAAFKRRHPSVRPSRARQPSANRSQRRQRGPNNHLASLTRDQGRAAPRQAERSAGPKRVMRQSESRTDRTEAARALLERVMEQRKGLRQ